MTRGELLAEGIESCKALMGRYLAGFDDTNRTTQASSLPNHVAWNLGHCAMTMVRVAERFDPGWSGKPGPLPASDFVEGGRGDASRFGVESVAFGSKPTDDPGAYPTMSRCVEIYNSACERLAATVRGAPDARLDAATPWGKITLTLREAVTRMIFHNGDHCGQIVDLRRALGFKPVLS